MLFFLSDFDNNTKVLHKTCFSVPLPSPKKRKKKQQEYVIQSMGFCNMRKLPWGLCLFHLYISLSLPLLIYDAIVSKLGRNVAGTENNRKLYYFFMDHLFEKKRN